MKQNFNTPEFLIGLVAGLIVGYDVRAIKTQKETITRFIQRFTTSAEGKTVFLGLIALLTIHILYRNRRTPLSRTQT